MLVGIMHHSRNDAGRLFRFSQHIILLGRQVSQRMVVDIDWKYRCLAAGVRGAWSFDFFDLVLSGGYHFTEPFGPYKQLMQA